MNPFVRSLSSVAAARVVMAIGGFFLFWLIATEAGTETLGGFALVLSLFLATQQLPLLGLHIPIARDIANGTRSPLEVFRGVLPISLFSAVVLMLVVVVVGRLAYPPALNNAFVLIALAIVPAAITGIAEAILIGQQRMEIIARVALTENLTRSIICIGLILAHAPLPWLFATLLVCRVGAGIFYLRLFPEARGRLSSVSPFLSQVPAFLGIAVLATVAARMDLLILGGLAGVVEAGVYAPAARLYEFGLLVPSIVATALFPSFSKAAPVRPQLVSLLMRVWRVVAWTTMLAVVPAALLAPTVVEMLFAPEAAATGLALSILCLALVLVTLDQTLTLALLAAGAQKWDLLSLCVGVLTGVTLLCLLTPSHGARGAAASVVAMMAVQLSFRLAIAIRVLEIRGLRRRLISEAMVPLTFSVIMMLASDRLISLGLPIVMAVLVGIGALGGLVAVGLSWKRALRQLKAGTAEAP